MKDEGGRMKLRLAGKARAFILHPSAFILKLWSGRRDLNPRLRPWQGRTLPLSYSRFELSILRIPYLLSSERTKTKRQVLVQFGCFSAQPQRPLRLR